MSKSNNEASYQLINGEEPIDLNYAKLRKIVLTLRALEHDLRKSMIRLLDKHNKLTVTEIYIKLRIEQSVASQHLAILRRANIVNSEKQGKFIYYSLNSDQIAVLGQLVDQLATVPA